MDIASGILHGLSLTSPKGDTTRPTSIRARQALFDSLGQLTAKSFADVFSGSGAMGLEAASRGAERVLFAEGSKSVCRVIRQNCDKANVIAKSAEFLILNAVFPGGLGKLASQKKYDIIFADPPYAESAKLLSDFLGNEDFTRWAEGALLVWEAPADKGGIQIPPPPWKLQTIRIFGAAKFLFLRAE